jgi:hypothetical protein
MVCALQPGIHPHPTHQEGGRILGVNSLLALADVDYLEMFDGVPVDFRMGMNALGQQPARGVYYSHTAPQKGPKKI